MEASACSLYQVRVTHFNIDKANDTETEDYFHRSRPIEQLESFAAKEAEIEESAGDIFREKFEMERNSES